MPNKKTYQHNRRVFELVTKTIVQETNRVAANAPTAHPGDLEAALAVLRAILPELSRIRDILTRPREPFEKQ